MIIIILEFDGLIWKMHEKIELKNNHQNSHRKSNSFAAILNNSVNDYVEVAT